MKILFLTDSVALPRKDIEGDVLYEDTYLSLLRVAYPEIDIFDFCQGGATVSDLYKACFYRRQFNPDVVFIQCGAVDSAPRAFTQLEEAVIRKFNIYKLSNIFRTKLRKVRNCKYTTIDEFERTLLKLIDSFSNSPKIYSIGVIRATGDYENKVPGITDSIVRYNEVLQKNTNYISNENFPVEGIMSDYHHVNVDGHKIMFDKISGVIRKELSDFNIRKGFLHGRIK